MLQSKLLSRKSKLKLYWTLIMTIVTYASETWVLKKNSVQKLIFERKILTKSLDEPKNYNKIY
jgi:hypothetical protein